MKSHPNTSGMRVEKSVDTPRLLRMTAVIRATGLARSTIYKLVGLGQFPNPVHITGRAVAWRAFEIDRWIDERPGAANAPARQARWRPIIGQTRSPVGVWPMDVQRDLILQTEIENFSPAPINSNVATTAPQRSVVNR